MLEKWISFITGRRHELNLSLSLINNYNQILVKYFGLTYFKEPTRKLGKKLRYEHSHWLVFLLTNLRLPYVYVALEFCEVLRYLDEKGYEEYLKSKINKLNGKKQDQLFQGNYHEIFIFYVFHSNKINIIPDYEIKDVIYDGYIVNSSNLDIIVESKEMLSKEELLEMYNVNLSMTAILEQDGMQAFGDHEPLLCGYYIPSNNLKTFDQDFNTHLSNFRKQKDEISFLRSELQSGEYVTDKYSDGIFINYPLPTKSKSVKYRTTIKGVELNFSYPRNDLKYIDRLIERGIRRKRKQHKKLKALKIICIGITNYLFGEPIQLKTFEEYRETIEGKLGKDTILFIIHKDLLNRPDYQISKLVFSPENLKQFAEPLNNYEIDFRKMNPR